MTQIISAVVGFSSGVVVGGGIVAFFTALGVVTRIIILSGTKKYQKLYPISILLGTISSTLVYLLDFNINQNKVLLILISFFMGIFVGMVASALAEVIDVIPVASVKFGITDWIYTIIFAMIIGKVCGSLLYWMVPGFY